MNRQQLWDIFADSKPCGIGALPDFEKSIRKVSDLLRKEKVILYNIAKAEFKHYNRHRKLRKSDTPQSEKIIFASVTDIEEEANPITFLDERPKSQIVEDDDSIDVVLPPKKKQKLTAFKSLCAKSRRNRTNKAISRENPW